MDCIRNERLAYVEMVRTADNPNHSAAGNEDQRIVLTPSAKILPTFPVSKIMAYTSSQSASKGISHKVSTRKSRDRPTPMARPGYHDASRWSRALQDWWV